jgi:hypothetical protein
MSEAEVLAQLFFGASSQIDYIRMANCTMAIRNSVICFFSPTISSFQTIVQNATQVAVTQS